jgi:hypothetical protein
MNNVDTVSKVSKPLVDVALYLRGDGLDPVQVTSMLGVTASKARQKGEKWYTSTNKEVTAKTGIWKLVSCADSTSLADKIYWLRQQFATAKKFPLDILGVQEVELSVFVALDTDMDGGADYESEISKDDTMWLGEIGAIVSFSFCYVRDS